ncbi:putative C6 transcription factor [Rosellinia necatrix]|uniref:Putative C6 transcription factor n=1 Tax=Rosellinia necatrix TaxID=77044 RepID=A0A1W2TSH7_ROSNE|nr:putative C6 transcription factor [Rosellinia necatrix]
MSEAERGLPSERRPACDNCKTRKTKCDRRSPCASCVTLDVACRTTHRVGEKRQRVLLSTKYEDAVQDVSRQLADVKEMLQAILSNKEAMSSTSCSPGASLNTTAYTPQPMIDEQVPVLDSVQDGYYGDTSFTSHAHRIKTTLEATLLPSELEFPPSTSQESTSTMRDNESAAAAVNPLIPPNDAGLGNMPLPPNEIVLKVLRLVKAEEQRFFVDLPLFDQDEFIAMCRDIYFATEPISLWTWICVNVGLDGLFTGISEASCKRLGVTMDEMRAHTRIPRSNAEAALRSLRLCSEPSTESCRALAVLANYYAKQGHSTIAWRLISGAARAALDLGLHRLPSDADMNNVPKEVGLFWHIYTWEKGLAMTCGKPPTIRHSDVTSGLHLLATPENRPGMLNTLYGSFVDMAVVMGEIQESLFSVVAQQSSQQIRLQHVKRLASRLVEILNVVKSVSPNDPSWEGLVSNNLGGISTTLSIVLHCQLAIVYRFLPPEFLNSHALQCSTECVREARTALSMLAKVGKDGVLTNINGWKTLLNTILSLVPLVPFIVLAGNAIATSSGNDLPLLSTIVSLLAPVAVSSPLVRKVHGACESLSRIADRIISSTSPSSFNGNQEYAQGQEQFDHAFPMGQQDWNSVMIGFGSEFENYDSRTLTNIIEPCFANTYW